jgi:predicted dehydrogenase
MSRTRIGVVGAGVIARRHVRTLAAFDDLDVAAVADMQVDRAEALAGTVGATSYGDVRQMLDGERLDAVYVCVPPFAHGEVELEVVERDLPLFVEKPLAADLDTAVRVARRVQDKGLVTGVGYHWRWLDTVERAQELLADRPARLVTGPGWAAPAAGVVAAPGAVRRPAGRADHARRRPGPAVGRRGRRGVRLRRPHRPVGLSRLRVST